MLRVMFRQWVPSFFWPNKIRRFILASSGMLYAQTRTRENMLIEPLESRRLLSNGHGFVGPIPPESITQALIAQQKLQQQLPPNIHRIANGARPRWSPDGTRIAYV